MDTFFLSFALKINLADKVFLKKHENLSLKYFESFLYTLGQCGIFQKIASFIFVAFFQCASKHCILKMNQN